jgi:adenylate cyclase
MRQLRRDLEFGVAGGGEERGNDGPKVRLRLLGGFAIDVDGRPAVVEARKNRGLLGIVVLSPGLAVSRERLVSLLWSDRAPEQARASLRQSLTVLRREVDNEATRLLAIDEDDVRVIARDLEVDALQFLALARSQKRDDLRAAATLYGGDFLEGVAIRDPAFVDWLGLEQGRFHRAITEVLDRLATVESGALALAAAQRLVALDPLREASQRRLMQVFADNGETAQALRQYDLCRTLLRDELGVEPAAETQELRKKLASTARVAPVAAARASAAAAGRTRSKPTVAVLPLANLSGDPSQDYFSDGITEDIITELSRFKNLAVIARASSFAFRGQPNAIDVIGRELGADYVLDGSIRRIGSRVRITAHLCEAGSANQVWAERYDRDVSDIFALHEDLARNIAGTLAIQLDDRVLAQARSKGPDDERAYEHWLKGKRHLWVEGALNLEARSHFERAIVIDPSLARAHAGAAVTYVEEAVQFPTRDEFRAALARGQEHAQTALELDPTESLAHIALAWTCLYAGDFVREKHHVELAFALNPNDADMLANSAYLLSHYGDRDAAVAAGRMAQRLNPRHPEWYDSFFSAALFHARAYEESFALRERAPDTFYDSPFLGAAALAYLGRPDEARAWGERAVARLGARLGGKLLEERGCIQLLLDNNPLRLQADRDHFAEGMRRAGIRG